MSFTLKNFDQAEDDEVTAKGLKYYNDGAVSNLEEVEDSTWEASVLGSSNPYTVAVHLIKSKIDATGCDCPAFAKDNYCKHVAAVLYAIRVRLTKDKGKAKDKPSKAKTPEQRLHDILEKVELKDLKSFIKNYAAHQKDFASDLLLYFKLQSVTNETSQEGFIEVVRAAIESSRIRSDIDSDLLTRNLKPIMTQAQRYFNDSNYLEAFYIIRAVLDVLTPMLSELNYTFTAYPNAYTQSLDLLQNIAGFTIPPMFRDEIFEYCLALSQRKEIAGYNYDKIIDQMLMLLASDTESREKVLQLIDRKALKITPYKASYEFDQNLSRHLAYIKDKISLLAAMHREAEADKVINENRIFHEDLRHIAIRKAIDNRDIKQARELINEKIEEIGLRHRGWQQDRENNKWRPYYLDIAIIENNVPEIITQAESVFKTTQEIKYYDILRQYYPGDKWSKKFEEIELFLFRKHYSFGILATIYIREEKIQDLFELLKKYPYLHNIQDTLPILLPGYGQEILTLYNKALVSLLGQATVKAYKEVVEHLGYLLAQGQKETVQYWIESFKSIYSNRPRFLKELNKLKL